MIRIAAVAGLCSALLAGCVTTPSTAPGDPGAGASPAFQPAPAPEPNTAAHDLSPAAATLVALADRLLQAGEAEAAASELERALRIDPRNPRIWQRMAVTRLELNDAVQAEALARKSNRLAADNPAIQSVNWRLIAESRRLRGDQPGYEAAMHRSRALLGQ